jgi:hypothetical protein
MVSTPNAPDGLFERIEKEPEEICLYKRLLLDYTYGLDRIYTTEEIEKAKASPSFEREYNLKYLGLIGNVFHTKDIDVAIEKGKKYNPDAINLYSRKSLGIDPGFGSSPFGLVITDWVDKQIQIAYAEEFERPTSVYIRFPIAILPIPLCPHSGPQLFFTIQQLLSSSHNIRFDKRTGIPIPSQNAEDEENVDTNA